MSNKVVVGLVLLATCWVGSATAQIERIQFTQAGLVELDAQMKRAIGHPNEMWRLRGLKAYQRGDDAEAVQRFTQAAKYADKYSQHLLSLMYWHGTGVGQDRVQAYIWSDLAAERGNRRLLLVREKMWAGLDAGQRAQVEAQGPEFYARYGDDVAMERANREVFSAITNSSTGITGSRAGYQTRLAIAQGGAPYRMGAGAVGAAYASVGIVNDEALYGRDRTDPQRYWREQDQLLESQVDVGPVQQVQQTQPDEP